MAKSKRAMIAISVSAPWDFPWITDEPKIIWLRADGLTNAH